MRQMYRVMNESFVGIKEAIIYGNQKKYHEEFLKQVIIMQIYKVEFSF